VNATEEISRTGSGAQISSKIRTYLEKELLVVRFLDWISEESFDFIFQQKIYDNYITNHTEQFLNVEKVDPTEKHRISRLREEYDRLGIKDAAFSIKGRSEEVARRNKIKGPYMKRFNIINIIIMAVLIGTIFLFYIPALEKYRLFSFLLILPVCFLPNFLKNQLKKKWNEFKYLHREELQEEIYEEIGKIKTFIQLLLDDARDYMLQERFPLQILEFPLMSNDYLNLELIKENIQQEQIQYVFKFEYPSGVEPFETPSATRVGGAGLPTPISNMDLAEDNTNDLFIIVKNPQYDKTGILQTKSLDYTELGYKPIAETLLENSNFDRIEDPSSIIKDIDSFDKITCTCGESVKIGEIQKVKPRSHSDFHFYLMIGEKCTKCGSNPFVLVPLPNMKVPPELADIFIDPIPLESKSSSDVVDLFSVLKDVVYDENRTLQLSDYVPHIIEDTKAVQLLLENSSFKKLKDPKKRFRDFDTYKIPCSCDDAVKLVNVQLVTSKNHKGFNFYLLMGERCEKCNVDPFMLVIAPDQEIPEELNTIF